MVPASQPIVPDTAIDPVPAQLRDHLPNPSRLVVDVSDPEGRLSVDLTERADFLRPTQGLLGASRVALATKRAIDIVGAGAALVVLSPIFVLAAILVRVSSPGPILYRQRRVGRNGKVFDFLKFRTMAVDAERRRSSLESRNECDGPVFKIREDPRVTPAGRLLRKFSVDELPQLVHVLRGEMSLVGPRPPLPEEVAKYDAWELQRLRVKPGITCIWQVNGRSDLDFETWVNMDVEYIRDWDLGLDLAILARTVPAVISGRGAY